ncbi:MAG: trypsin-like peptidase domain-containing protein, partial [Christensenellales bacterium]|nr:trypsin-like peptidase domain-containing protein [Christensenellales bacterium]
MKKHPRLLGLTLSLLVVCAVAFAAGTMQPLAKQLPAATEATAEAVAEAVATPLSGDPSPALYVAERNENSVVGVLSYSEAWNRMTGEVENVLMSQGSGVVIQEGGYILTNYHIISGGTSFKVLMPSGEKVDATLTGSDSSMDIAVLKVSGEAADALVPVAVADMGTLKVGATVVAIGNPGG